MRSPDAPKMTSVVAPGVGSIRRLSRSGFAKAVTIRSMIPNPRSPRAAVLIRVRVRDRPRSDPNGYSVFAR